MAICSQFVTHTSLKFDQLSFGKDISMVSMTIDI